MKPIRNSAKALIIEDGRLLCTRNRDRDGDFFLLPGGGQQPGETLVAALRRECREEVGADVEVGDLRLVREYIAAHHEFAHEDLNVHQNEYMFLCQLQGELPSTPPAVPDEMQVGVEWVPLADLAQVRIYPKVLAAILAGGKIPHRQPVYLGDVN